MTSECRISPETLATLQRERWEDTKNQIDTSDHDDYLCYLSASVTTDLTPEQVLALIVFPSVDHLFRDVSCTTLYELESSNDQDEQVTVVKQRAVLRCFYIPFYFSVHSQVSADFRIPSVQFRLRRCGLLSKFEGDWKLTPQFDSDGKFLQTVARLEQGLTPWYAPRFIRRFFRGLAILMFQRMCEDLVSIENRLHLGESFVEILQVEGNVLLKKNPWFYDWLMDKEAKGWEVKKEGN